jgi:hypothetical protein
MGCSNQRVSNTEAALKMRDRRPVKQIAWVNWQLRVVELGRYGNGLDPGSHSLRRLPTRMAGIVNGAEEKQLDRYRPIVEIGGSA